MNKIYILLIASLFAISGFIAVYGQQDAVQDNRSAITTNNTSTQNIWEQVSYDYQHGIRFKDVIPVALGILGFSYFIWKSGSVLSKREVFLLKTKYTPEGITISRRRKNIFYLVKYLIFFPMMLYGWVVVCFFFMYALNTSLSFGTLVLIMVGIITASRIAAYCNEKLAEDIMKFLPFNLLFTLLINPVLNEEKILSSMEHFPVILLELTIFIAFTGALEAILKLVHFLISKSRHPSTGPSPPITKT